MILINSNSEDRSTVEVLRWLKYYDIGNFRINGDDLQKIEKIEITNSVTFTNLLDLRTKNSYQIERMNSFW
jgi:hypothetical protein